MPEGVAIVKSYNNNRDQDVVFTNNALFKIIGQSQEDFNILNNLKNADIYKEKAKKIREKIEKNYLER